MSIGYKTRKKRIRDYMRENGDKLKWGKIPKKIFAQLQADWDREITGPPIGTLEDLHAASRHST